MRSGVLLPSLKMIAAEAPAASALTALSTKPHVPRWMSATLPAGNPAKSDASHPLVDPPTGGSSRSTAVIGATTSPLPENSIVAKSVSATNVLAVGAVCSNTGGESSSKKGKSNRCTLGE